VWFSVLAPGASTLYAALPEADAEIAVVHDGEWMQPVLALITRGLRSSLSGFLAEGGRKIYRWYAQHRLAIATFSDTTEALIIGRQGAFSHFA